MKNETGLMVQDYVAGATNCGASPAERGFGCPRCVGAMQARSLIAVTCAYEKLIPEGGVEWGRLVAAPSPSILAPVGTVGAERKEPDQQNERETGAERQN